MRRDQGSDLLVSDVPKHPRLSGEYYLLKSSWHLSMCLDVMQPYLTIYNTCSLGSYFLFPSWARLLLKQQQRICSLDISLGPFVSGLIDLGTTVTHPWFHEGIKAVHCLGNGMELLSIWFWLWLGTWVSNKHPKVMLSCHKTGLKAFFTPFLFHNKTVQQNPLQSCHWSED